MNIKTSSCSLFNTLIFSSFIPFNFTKKLLLLLQDISYSIFEADNIFYQAFALLILGFLKHIRYFFIYPKIAIIAAGVIPEIRLASPSVLGLAFSSLATTSLDNPPICE